MFTWIKKKLGITILDERTRLTNIYAERTRDDVRELKRRVTSLEKQFEENNRLSADISMKDTSYIVLSGNWRGKPYVNIYPLFKDEMDGFVKEFKHRFEGREFKLDAPCLVW